MSQQRGFDTSIPVLTELFVDKGEAAPEGGGGPQADATLPAQPGPDAAPVADVDQDQTNAHLEARALAHWTEPEWNLLERRLSERILQQMQGRVDFVLEQRLRDSMEDVLQGAMAQLTAEIRSGLQKTIDTIVVRAVAQELAHLQTLKK